MSSTPNILPEIKEEPQPSSQPDLFKHTPIRYLGYANEVGESFRKIIGSKWVNVTYGIAMLYVVADTVDKSYKSYNKYKGQKKCSKKVGYVAADTLLWQTLASVIIPGFTINRIVAMSDYLLKRSKSLPKANRKILVTAIGLASIPFIIKPIDYGVDEVLDRSFRKLEPE